VGVVLVFPGDLVEASEVNAKSKRAIFFWIKEPKPHGRSERDG